MKKQLMSLAAAALLIGGASAAPAANKASQGEAIKAAEGGSGAGGAKKICRRLETTGSRLGTGAKACHTKEEWKKIEQMN
jgi:hypothetical protein